MFDFICGAWTSVMEPICSVSYLTEVVWTLLLWITKTETPSDKIKPPQCLKINFSASKNKNSMQMAAKRPWWYSMKSCSYCVTVFIWLWTRLTSSTLSTILMNCKLINFWLLTFLSWWLECELSEESWFCSNPGQKYEHH